jgi:hypothetical protein
MMTLRTTGPGLRGGRPFLARVAEAETMRRLDFTAIAIERYHVRHGAYPKELAQLVPEILKSVPIDFMDGEPLRYHLEDDGRFVLYSVGLDCEDNHGLMPRRQAGRRFGQPGGLSYSQGTDLVWPKPASQAEVSAEPEPERSNLMPSGFRAPQMEFFSR